MFNANVKFWNFDTNKMEVVSASGNTREKAISNCFLKAKKMGLSYNDMISVE